jgi:hypothetical protein
MRPKTYRTVIFEGNEVTGKSTLMRAFEKATDFRYPCLDRWLVSALVYNGYKNRHDDQNEDMFMEIDDLIIGHDVLIVYLVVPMDIQKLRFAKRGDWLYAENDLMMIDTIYTALIAELYQQYPSNILILKNEDGDMNKNITTIKTKVDRMVKGA